jgi:ketosteroid isomerase-like protein
LKKLFSIVVILFILLNGCQEKSRMLEREMPENLKMQIAALDSSFSHDHADEVASYFAGDARLMWPNNNDIVGREAIRKALNRLMEIFTTISWKPDRHFLHVYQDRAYVLGRFVEVRKRRDDELTETVYGRMVEVWELQVDGNWYIERYMTSRYAKTEISSP